MKKLSVLFMIGAGFLIASCSTQQSLVKRHYNKGYYVDHIASVEKSRPVAVKEALPAVAAKPVTEKVLNTEKEEVLQASTSKKVQVNTVATASVTSKHQDHVVSSDMNDQGKTEATPILSSKESTRPFAAISSQKEHSTAKDDAMFAVLILLCIFLPFIAVPVKEKSITINFWIDLLLCILFYLPGIIFAFYICFFK
jgi:uncharacterized membrane protein YqaE (UPF0057 family)